VYCSSLVGEVGDHLRDQTRFGMDTELLGGPADRLFQLVRGKRRDRLAPGGEQLREPGIGEWSVVEVRAQRDDDPQPTLRIGNGHAQRLEKLASLALVPALGEHLLELIDDEHHLGVRGHHQIDGPQEPTGASIEYVMHAGRRPNGNAQ
jgi:hypothetical protein